MNKIHKFQAAYDAEIDEEMLGFDCLSFNRTGRVVRIVVRGNAEEIEAKLRALNPLFIEEISVDFEELFSCEVESRGYLK